MELAIELKEDALLQVNASVIDGNVVLCGLILEGTSNNSIWRASESS